MKNVIKTLVFVMTLVLVLVAFTGCDLEQEINNKKCEILGHSIVLYADEYYCEEEGLSAGAICEVCGYVERQRFPLKATGHDFADATCTEPKTCKTCGKTEGVANNHKWVMVDAVAPTCTKDGLEAYTHCEVCKEYLEGEPAAIPATGHTLTTIDALEATCITDGHTAYQVCDNCDYYAGYAIVSGGHQLGEDGVCSVCNGVAVTNDEELAAAVKNAETGAIIIINYNNATLPTLANKTGITITGLTTEGNIIGGTGVGTAFGGNFGANNTLANLWFMGDTNGVRYSYAQGGTTTFITCMFYGKSTYGFHIDESKGATFEFQGCGFYGFNAFAGDLVKTTFNGCGFFSNGNYGHTNIWSVGEFNDCIWGDGVTFGPRGDNAHIFVDGVEQVYTTEE